MWAPAFNVVELGGDASGEVLTESPSRGWDPAPATAGTDLDETFMAGSRQAPPTGPNLLQP